MNKKIRCRHRLASPQMAGAISWDVLKEWLIDNPHLRPCPRRKDRYGIWNWIYWKSCEKCPDKLIKK